jgi:general secretion pathway protein D
MTKQPQLRLLPLIRRTTALTLAALTLVSSAQTPIPMTPASAAQTPPAQASASQPSAVITPPPGRRQSQSAEDAYLTGARLLDRNDLAAAETQFNKALKLNPGNRDYVMAAAIVHQNRVAALVQQASQARILGQNSKADALIAEAKQLDPSNSIVTQHADPGPLRLTFNPQPSADEGTLNSLASLAGPIVLTPKDSTQSFHLRSDVQDIVRQVFSAYGIKPTFDESVAHQSLRLDLDNTTYQQSSHIVLEMAHLFAVPLDPTSIIIAKDTLENRQRFERQLEETVAIPGMTNEQMGELGNVVRNVFDLKQVTVQNGLGSLVIRAPESILKAVNLTLADIVDGGSQVMFDLRIYAIDKSRKLNTGAQPPQQFGVYNVAGAAASLVNANQSLVNQAIAQGLIPAGSSNVAIALGLIASGLVQSTLLSSTIGIVGGSIDPTTGAVSNQFTTTGITSSSTLAFNLALTSSETHSVDAVQLRVGDRQTANFRAGSRYPITTSTYTVPSASSTAALSGLSINGTSASSLLNSLSTNSIPQIQYEDLGITLKATPTVQKSGVITMHLDLKIEALTGGTIDNIPILDSRQYVGDTTVGDGESALLASSITKSEAAAISGLPGLGQLPGFQSVASNLIKQADTSELVILITPHLVRRRSNIIAGPRIAVDLPGAPD